MSCTEVEVVELAKEVKNIPEPIKGATTLQPDQISLAVEEADERIYQVADDETTAELVKASEQGDPHSRNEHGIEDPCG